MYRRMQASLMQRIDAAEDGPNWAMPIEMRAELAEIDAFLARSSAAITNVHEVAMKLMEAATTEQLEKQLRAELLMAAKTFTPVEWAILDEARIKQRHAVEREAERVS